jgi:hypothetical protein
VRTVKNEDEEYAVLDDYIRTQLDSAARRYASQVNLRDRLAAALASGKADAGNDTAAES